MVVAYGVCVGSLDKVRRYVLPRVSTSPILLRGRTSITAAYNEILAAVRSRTDVDALVLLHDDLELVDPDAEDKFLAALAEPDVAIAGVAGGRGVFSLAWWEAPERFGYQLTDSGPLVFGPRHGDVDSLEGSVLAFSRWAIDNLRYDESMTGFHCCDEICIGAVRAGRRVVVTDVDTHHHTVLGFKSEDARREWFANDAAYRRKWSL